MVISFYIYTENPVELIQLYGINHFKIAFLYLLDSAISSTGRCRHYIGIYITIRFKSNL